MRPAVVTGQDLDILLTVTAIELVFDAEVREMDAVVEVRQLVFARPFRNLTWVTTYLPIIYSTFADRNFPRRLRGGCGWLRLIQPIDPAPTVLPRGKRSWMEGHLRRELQKP